MKIKCFIFLMISFLCYGEEAIKPDKLILYKKTSNANLYLHAFYPKEISNKDNLPTIVFFFGGGWISENKTQFYRQAKYLSTLGMAAFCADYRVRSVHGVTPDQCVIDAKSAIRYIRKNKNQLCVNSNKIIASGGSAGGHLAASTATLSSFNDNEDDLTISAIPNALILFNPVLNTANIKRLGDLSKEISPFHHLTSNTPPTLIMHGTSDSIVSHNQAIEFHDKMRNLQNISKLKLYEKMPHGFFNNKKYNQTLKETENFIRSLQWIE